MSSPSTLPDALLASLVAEFAPDDTHAMLLTGSYARGTATRYSDVDLVRFVDELPASSAERYTLRYRANRLVSVSTTTVIAKRDELRNPATAIFAVEGLRSGHVLFDRDGQLATLLAEAAAFEWAPLQPAANVYASDLLMGLAEEAHKALSGLARGDESLMLYGSLGLVGALPRVLIVQRGILLVSENDYLEGAQRAAGRDSVWSRLFRQLTGYDPLLATSSLATARATAALNLYLETARLIADVLTGEDAAVVAQAVQLIEGMLQRTAG